MKITSENYEEIMFLLTEEQFPEKEKQALLAEISADSFLASEWGKWKATRMEDPLDPYQKDAEVWSASFLKNGNRKRTALRVIIPVIMSAAAVLLIFLLMKFAFRSSGPVPGQHSAEKSFKINVQPIGKTGITVIKSSEPVRIHASAASHIKLKTARQSKTPRPKDTLSPLTSVTTLIRLDLAVRRIEPIDNYRITITENLPVESVNADNQVNFGDLMTDTHLALVSGSHHKYPAIRISGANSAAVTLNLKKVSTE